MLNFKKQQKLCLIIFSCTFVFFFASCRPHPVEILIKKSERKYLMGTHVQLDICVDKTESEENIAAAFAKAWERLEDISWRMNIFDERSDPSALNNSFDAPVTVGADTYYVINQSLYYTKLTGGAFDITILPLLQFWKEMARTAHVPEETQVQRVKKSVGSKNIRLLENNQIERLNTQTKIDLGGIAKGYAIDEAARIFKEFNIDNMFIDAGGDIYAGGVNCQKKPWRIGIRHPLDINKLIDVIEITNMAVTTSGNYAQYFELNKNKLSHIINPVTGYPQQYVVSATVIAPTAMAADALSTAMCVLGHPKGTGIIDQLGKDYASLIITYDETHGDVKLFSRDYSKYQVSSGK